MNGIRDGAPGGSRRRVIETLASAAGLWLVGCRAASAAPVSPSSERAGDKDDDDQEAEVTPGEDLMQEHGVVERILLIYDEVAGRLERGEPVELSLVGRAAEIVKGFVEAYHEKNEERFVFPRLEAAGQQLPLVATLRAQHDKGRELTTAIGRAALGAPDTAALARSLRAFARMYRPHAAWEDTVVFPAFRRVVGRSAYHELGEELEQDEHARFGEHGFEDTVARLLAIEQALGIAELSSYTPA